MESISEQTGVTLAVKKEIDHHTRLTATELGNLWTSYMNYTLISNVLRHFNANVEDQDVKALLEEGKEIADKRVTRVMEILNQEQYSIPVGFSGEDIVTEAPRLYSDVFYLFYLGNMTRIGLSTNSLFLTTSVRTDVREFYHECNLSTMRLFDKTTNIMLAKGILIRPPYITTSKTVDLVKRQDFLAGFLGEKRPLLALEISSLHYLILTNFIGKSLLRGFRQVAESSQVRDYLDRGVKLAMNIMDTYGRIMSDEDLPLPMMWDSMVTESDVAPFSDKLMMFHTSVLNAADFQNIGAALSTTLRHDLAADLFRTLADIAAYAEDGINIMIDNGWMEEPPRQIDRNEVSQRN